MGFDILKIKESSLLQGSTKYLTNLNESWPNAFGHATQTETRTRTKTHTHRHDSVCMSYVTGILFGERIRVTFFEGKEYV